MFLVLIPNIFFHILGKVVTQGINKYQNEKYDGSLAGMDEDFKEELAKVIVQILSPENLIPKRFNGKYLNAAEFLDHMQQYFKFYLTNKAPEVQTVLESIVENEMKALLTICVDKYKEAYRKNQISLNNLDKMQTHHDNCKASTIILFKDSVKIGEPEDELMYMERLAGQLDNIYNENVKQFEANEKKIEEEKKRSNQNMQHVQAPDMQYNQHQTIPQQTSSYGQNQLVRNKIFTRGHSMPANASLWDNPQPNSIDRNQFDRNDQLPGSFSCQQAALPSKQEQYERSHTPFLKDFGIVDSQQASNQSLEQYNQQQHSHVYNPNQANNQLVKMFENPFVKTRKIVALSIVGPYRKGKSLFLNYCLRYLYAHVRNHLTALLFLVSNALS